MPDGIQDELDICHKMERAWSTLQAILNDWEGQNLVEKLMWTVGVIRVSSMNAGERDGSAGEIQRPRGISVKRCEAAAPAVPAPPNPYDFQKPLKGPHFQHLPISSSLFPEDFAATCHVEFELKSIPWHFLRKT